MQTKILNVGIHGVSHILEVKYDENDENNPFSLTQSICNDRHCSFSIGDISYVHNIPTVKINVRSDNLIIKPLTETLTFN